MATRPTLTISELSRLSDEQLDDLASVSAALLVARRNRSHVKRTFAYHTEKILEPVGAGRAPYLLHLAKSDCVSETTIEMEQGVGKFSKVMAQLVTMTDGDGLEMHYREKVKHFVPFQGSLICVDDYHTAGDEGSSGDLLRRYVGGDCTAYNPAIANELRWAFHHCKITPGIQVLREFVFWTEVRSCYSSDARNEDMNNLRRTASFISFDSETPAKIPRLLKKPDPQFESVRLSRSAGWVA